MDEDRRIRFLVSPLVFLVSLLWAVFSDPEKSVTNFLGHPLALPNGDLSTVLTTAAAAGSAVFVLGVSIGTISYVGLRFVVGIARWTRGRSHEIALTPQDLAAAWKLLGGDGDPPTRSEVFIGVTVDHGLLQERHPGIHKWIVRRWNAFSINLTSATALVLSLGVGAMLGLRASLGWVAPATAMTVVFAIGALWAWRDTMRMLGLHIQLGAALPKPS